MAHAEGKYVTFVDSDDYVTEQKPDLILMTGDMLDRTDENADVACALIRELTAVAPVYYGYGNHEYAWMERNEESLTPVIEEAGATVLDVAYTDIEVNGQVLRLGGSPGIPRINNLPQIVVVELNSGEN